MRPSLERGGTSGGQPGGRSCRTARRSARADGDDLQRHSLAVAHGRPGVHTRVDPPAHRAMGDGHVAQLTCSRRPGPVEHHAREPALETLATATALASGECLRRPEAYLARACRAGRGSSRRWSGFGNTPDVRAKRAGWARQVYGKEDRAPAGDEADSRAGHEAVDVRRDRPAARELVVAPDCQLKAVAIRTAHGHAGRNRARARCRNYHPRPGDGRAVHQQEAFPRRRGRGRRRDGTHRREQQDTRHETETRHRREVFHSDEFQSHARSKGCNFTARRRPAPDLRTGAHAAGSGR